MKYQLFKTIELTNSRFLEKIDFCSTDPTLLVLNVCWYVKVINTQTEHVWDVCEGLDFAMHPSRPVVAVAAVDRQRIHIINVVTREWVDSIHIFDARCLKFGPDGTLAVAVAGNIVMFTQCDDGWMRQRVLSSPEPTFSWTCPIWSVRSLNFNKWATSLAVIGSNTVLIFKKQDTNWNVCMNTPPSNTIICKGGTFTDEGHFVFQKGAQHIVLRNFWQQECDQQTDAKPIAHATSVNSMILNNEKEIICAKGDGKVEIFGKECYSLNAHHRWTRCVSLNSEGILASAGFDGTIKLWKRDLLPKENIVAANMVLFKCGLHADVRDCVFKQMGVLDTHFVLHDCYK